MSLKKNILDEYVCEVPFVYTDVHQTAQYLCCPSWSPLNIKTNQDGHPNTDYFNESDDVYRNWISDNAIKIRNSVYDGTYSECNHNVCPKLNQLINSKNIPTNFLSKSEFNKKYNIECIEDISKFKTPPEEILFGFDRSCNLQCPSCRLEFVANDRINSVEYKNKLHLLNSIEDGFGKNLKRILITGSGDPFYSNLYREYLQKFDIKKYPKLEKIQLITNGKMLNKKMWESLNSAPYIKFIEISIDAGTKDTYENTTRLKGKWETLISNLEFIATIDTVDEIVCSMVVSKHNYKEMYLFYELIKNIFINFNKKIGIHYRQIVDWNTYSKEELVDLQVFEKTHELYDDFLIELKKIHGKRFVNHNFHHIYSDIEYKKETKFYNRPLI